MSYTMTDANRDFDWLGIPIKVHKISDFAIIEYRDKAGITSFGGVVAGKPCGESWATLDCAIIGMICRKYNEVNTAMRVTYLVAKMLSVPSLHSEAA